MFPSDSTQDIATQFSTKLYELECPPTVRINIDYACVQDYRLGALLSMIKTEEEYNYILTQLKRYEQAVDRKVAKYFPKLGISDAQITQVLQYPESWAAAVRAAPMTELFIHLIDIVTAVLNHNTTRIMSNPLEIVFRLPPGKILDKPQMAVLINACNKIDNNQSVRIIFKSFTFEELPDEYLDCVQIWILDDLEEFVNSSNISEPYLSKGCMQDWIVIARPRLNDVHADLPLDQIDKGIADIELVFKHLSDFHFLPHRILTA